MSRPTITEMLMLDSHLSKVDDPIEVGPETTVQAPTSAQKWWTSVLLGMLFAIVSSSFCYGITNWATNKCGGISTSKSGGPTLVGLLIHTVIFILLVRIVLG
jgi:hypothetical protein